MTSTTQPLNTIEIKQLHPEDWEKYRDLYLKLLKSDPDAFVDDYEDTKSKTEHEWKKTHEKKGATFVALDNGNFIAMGKINLDDELPDTPVLSKLGVLLEYRGKGIAKKLVEVREDWARKQGYKRVRLYVFTGREKTVEFSIKNGYNIVEVTDNVIPRKDGSFISAVILEKDLQ